MSMQDTKLIFSDGQSITAAAYSTNFLDLEEGSVVGQQVGPAWLCFRVVASSGRGGLTNGLTIRMNDRGDASFSGGNNLGGEVGTEDTRASIEFIPPGELVDGYAGCVGFLFDDLKRYLKVYFDTNADVETGTLTFDVWIQNQPITILKTQKLPIV